MIKLQMLLAKGADAEALRKAAEGLGIRITSMGAASAVGEIEAGKFAELFGAGAESRDLEVPGALRPFVQSMGVAPRHIYLK